RHPIADGERTARMLLAERLVVAIEVDPLVSRVIRKRRARRLAAHEVVVSDGGEVASVRCTEAIPQIEARIDLERIEHPCLGVGEEVDLERASEPQLPRDVVSALEEPWMIHELDEGAFSREHGVGANLPASISGEHSAPFIGEAVEREQAPDIARQILL